MMAYPTELYWKLLTGEMAVDVPAWILTGDADELDDDEVAGDDDDEGGTDDRAPSPPSPGGSAGEFAPVSPPEVEPTPILPVLLLPETGLREAQIGAGLRGALPWLAALGLTLASLALWQKAKRRK